MGKGLLIIFLFLLSAFLWTTMSSRRQEDAFKRHNRKMIEQIRRDKECQTTMDTNTESDSPQEEQSTPRS